MNYVVPMLAMTDCGYSPVFAAEDPRWIRQPSSDYPSTRDSVQKQVMLNAYEI